MPASNAPIAQLLESMGVSLVISTDAFIRTPKPGRMALFDAALQPGGRP